MQEDKQWNEDDETSSIVASCGSPAVISDHQQKPINNATEMELGKQATTGREPKTKMPFHGNRQQMRESTNDRNEVK